MSDKTLLKETFFKKDFNSKNANIQRKLFGNTIINNYNGRKEIIVYKKDFEVPAEVSVNTNIDRTRHFIYNESGYLEPVEQLNNLVELLQNSLRSSRKRTLDNLYGYCLSNNFDYFITLTFRPDINRYDINEVNYAWQKFKQKMQYYFKDITIILIPEPHPKSGAFHFHGLIGNANLDKYLEIAINNNKDSQFYGQPLKNKFGRQIYNFNSDFYQYGFSTIVKIEPDTPKKKIVNYLIKYISKEIVETDKGPATNVRYNKKSYYHTRNLIRKEKQVCHFEMSDLEEILKSFEKTKENDKFIVFEIKD